MTPAVRTRVSTAAISLAACCLAAACALAQAPSSATSGGTTPTMHLRSFTVIVRDYDEAKDWYVGKLGFQTLTDQKFADQRFVLVAPAGQSDVGIVLEKAKRTVVDPSMPSDYSDRIGKEVNIVLTTNDLSALAKTLRERGVHFREEPTRHPWGGEAVVEDLYGNSIVLVGPIRANAGSG